jgi:hypothetical protein
MRKNHCLSLSFSTTAPDLHDLPFASTYHRQLVDKGFADGVRSDLLISQYGLIYWIVVDHGFRLICKLALVEHEENPLGVLIEGR